MSEPHPVSTVEPIEIVKLTTGIVGACKNMMTLYLDDLALSSAEAHAPRGADTTLTHDDALELTGTPRPAP